MATTTLSERAARPAGIKEVPREEAARFAIRRLAQGRARMLDQQRPPTREDLERAGGALLNELGLTRGFLGFAMVAVSNAFWHDAFAAVPPSRRLLLLPKCLSDSRACSASLDSVGLHCAGCGRCSIHDLKREAESLGYRVNVAEGTSSVLMRVVDGEADALLGVACLDSLEKSFTRVVDLGIPHVAVPLLTDGCVDTEAEIGVIRSLLSARRETAPAGVRTYVPLLRETARTFAQPSLSTLLAAYLACSGEGAPESRPLAATDAVALEWLEKGGKRLRPFVTLAAYSVARHGVAALAPDADVSALIPPAVRRIALAIETLHKASLVHDDIEDDDAFRYGSPTIHRVHGTGTAINVGDYLVGLGYRLIAGETAALGAPCIADILGHLSAAHLELCRGQGAELVWRLRDGKALRPADVLAVGALKTAPAFEVALYAGLRAAGLQVDRDLLRRFATYVGEGYQVLNDLEDWQGNEGNKRHHGLDALAARPTILRAFALEAGCGPELAALLAERDGQAAPAVREVYSRAGAFEKAERLLEKLRGRALALAAEMELPALRELAGFLVRIILRDPGADKEHGA